jgi:hypothetical protein
MEDQIMSAIAQNRWLVALLCVNVILITAIVVSLVGLPQAQAQVRPYDYLLIPGYMREDEEIVWIVDMGTYQLCSAYFNRSSSNIEFGEVISLTQFR